MSRDASRPSASPEASSPSVSREATRPSESRESSRPSASHESTRPNAPLQVRRGFLTDARAIAEVHVRSWQVAYRGLVPDEVLDALSVGERETRWREWLDGDLTHPVYVALRDERVVGFCGLSTPGRDDDAGASVAEIAAFYVHPEAWRSGAGRALVQRAFTDLRGVGWQAVTLWVLAENHRARAFYASLGLEPDGAEAIEHHSGLPEIRMRAAPVP